MSFVHFDLPNFDAGHPTKDAKGPPTDSEQASSAVGTIVLNRFDVCFGRGKFSREHTGNLHCFHLVTMHQDEHEKGSRSQKTNTVFKIMRMVHDSGGRFLEWTTTKQDDTDELATCGWIEVPQKRAMEKVSRMFRDLQARQRKKQKEQQRLQQQTKAGQGPVTGPSQLEVTHADHPTKDAKGQPTDSEQASSAVGTFVLNRFDVIFGRGKFSHKHTGNLRCFHLVTMHQDEHERGSRSQKTNTVFKIMRMVHDSGGRFLEWTTTKQDDTDELATCGWIEVPQKRAMEKVSRMFRDLQARQRKKQKEQQRLQQQTKAGQGPVTGPSQLEVTHADHPTKDAKGQPTDSEQASSAVGTFVLNRFDVIFGRGKFWHKHTGNLRCFHLVKMHQDEYEKASKSQKTDVVLKIIRKVHELDGRFLEWTKMSRDDTDELVTCGWIVVPEKRAKDKVSQFFRDLRVPQRKEHKELLGAGLGSGSEPSHAQQRNVMLQRKRLQLHQHDESPTPPKKKTRMPRKHQKKFAAEQFETHGKEPPTPPKQTRMSRKQRTKLSAEQFKTHERELAKLRKQRQRKQKDELPTPPEERRNHLHQKKQQRCNEHLSKCINNLMNRATFALNELNNSLTFEGFQNNPETAAMLLHFNSGHHKFLALENILSMRNSNEWIANPSKWNSTLEQILAEIEEEIVTPLEKQQLSGDYLKFHGRHATWDTSTSTDLPGLPSSIDSHHLCCGMCGIKSVNSRGGQQCQVVPLSDLPDAIKLTSSQQQKWAHEKSQPPIPLPVDTDGNLEPFHLHKLRSIHDSQALSASFHLHPEFVHAAKRANNPTEEECTVLCPDCSDWLDMSQRRKTPVPPPKCSLAGGTDYGDARRLGLSKLTTPERLVIAKLRHFHNVVSIRNNHEASSRSDGTKCQFKAHSILFRHDAPVECSKKLLHDLNPVDSLDAFKNFLQENLTVQFVGPDGSIDKMTRKANAMAHLKVRPHVVFQWLAVLRHSHSLYHQDEMPAFNEFAQRMQHIQTCLVEGVINVTDKTTVNVDKFDPDDVANVRSRILTNQEAEDLQMQDIANEEDEIDIATTSSCLKDIHHVRSQCKELLTDRNQRKHILAKASTAFGTPMSDVEPDADDNDHKMCKSRRDSDPLSEFHDLPELLTGAWPDVFMFGTTWCQKGSITKQQVEHLLRQHTNAAACSSDLLYYLYDVKERHQVIRNFNTKIRKDPTAFRKFANLVVSDKFQNKLKQAVQDPESVEANQVLKIILPILSFGGRNTVAGVLNDITSLERAMAVAKRHGPPTHMLTVTPDDVNTPTSFRLACTSCDNVTFPAIADEAFFDALRQNSDLTTSAGVRIPLGYSSRFKAAANNPVAVALEFRALVENILSILLRCPLDIRPSTNGGARKTWYFKDRNSPRGKGIFGHVTTTFGCIETQERGALHFHILIWGGITPKLLEESVGIPELCAKIEQALNSIATAELPRQEHLAHLIKEQMKHHKSAKQLIPSAPTQYPSMDDVPPPLDLPSTWQSQRCKCTLQQGIHVHSFSCHKLPSGAWGCRSGFPCGPCPATGPRCLEVPPDTDFNTQKLNDIIPIESTKPIEPMSSPLDRDFQKHPLRNSDDRLIVWELQRKTLDPLPDLPLNLRNAVNESISLASNGQLPSSQCKRLQTMLQDTRSFCISKLQDALHLLDTPDEALSMSLLPSLPHWTKDIDTLTLVAIYDMFSEKLQNHNGSVVSTNDVIHICTGSSTNVVLLGNVQQSRASLFYVAPYLCKNKTALQACLVALEHARQHIQKHPSVADDTGSAKRTVQHMFTRVINNLSKCIQVSDTQVALALLGMGTEIASDAFQYFSAQHAVNLFIHNLFHGHTDPQDVIVPDSELINDLLGPSPSSQLDTHQHSTMVTDDSSIDTTDTQSLASDDELLCDDVSHSNDDHCPPMLDDDLQSEGLDITNMNRKSFGTAPVYLPRNEDDEPIPTPVHYATHYWFRGEDLKQLTMFEYNSIVDIVKKTKRDKPTSSTTGPKFRRTFDFHPNHPLHESHTQVLKSKQHTLIFNARPPKRPGSHPGEISENATACEQTEHREDVRRWTSRANKFAQFYSTVFLPNDDVFGDNLDWTIAQKVHHVSWTRLCHAIESMEKSPLLIDKMRLASLFTFEQGLRSNNRAARLFTNWRHRCSTKWSTEERAHAKSIHDMHGLSTLKSRFSLLDDVEDASDSFEFNFDQIHDAKQVVKFQQQQRQALSLLFENGNPSQTPNTSTLPFPWDTFETGTLAMKVNDTADAIRKARLPRDIPSDQPSPSDGSSLDPDQDDVTSHHDSSSPFETSNLSPTQLKLVNKFDKYFKRVAHHKCQTGLKHPSFLQLHHASIDPPQILLTGDPGSGKSFTVETICVLAAHHGLGPVLTTSYNGIAAVNVDGSTISSMFKIFEGKSESTIPPLDCETLQQMRMELNTDNISMLVVDEVSTIDARIIGILDLRLRQLLDNDLPFGGVPVLFGGDFNQLGPVRKKFLPQDMISWAIRLHHTNCLADPPPPSTDTSTSHPSAPSPTKPLQGDEFFANFNNIVKKKKKTKREKRLAEIAARFPPTSLAYRGCYLFSKLKRFHLKEQHRSIDADHNAFIQNLSLGKPMSLATILSYESLTKQDITMDDDWTFAPVLVASNLERVSINRDKARLWAQRHQTHVFKWKCHVHKHRNPPLPELAHSIENEQPFFWQYFVKGAQANLSRGINNDLALVNGSPICLHSLTLSSPEERMDIEQLVQTLPPGHEIEIQPPTSVNVEIIPTLDSKTVSPRRQRQLDELCKFNMHADFGNPVVPITVSMNNHPKHTTYKYFHDDNLLDLAEVQIAEPFPFDLAFSMTIHKAQGRTLPRIVVDLNKHPIGRHRMQYAAVLVAMTRVKQKCHLRRLKHSQKDETTMHEYLAKLKPSHCLLQFLAGYIPDQNGCFHWDPNVAVQHDQLLK